MKNRHIAHILEKKVLPNVTKPGRYLGNETNTIIKDALQTEIRFAIAFPDVYEIAMSSQAVSILYHILNKIDYVWAERVFAPWMDMEDSLRHHDIPLFSLESFTPLNQFDIIGFTLQYELTYTNILNMLDLSRIPLYAKDRTDSDPLIIGGGPCSCNPEPMADFFDVFFIGDAEEGLEKLCSVVREHKKKSLTRLEILEELALLPGIYIPSFYQTAYDNKGRFTSITGKNPVANESVQTRIVAELKAEHLPHKPVVPLIEITHNRLAIEIMRGCTEGCRYCNAGMIYRPVRERDSGSITSYTGDALSSTGYDEISFLSLSTSDYSQLPSLMQEEHAALVDKRVNVSLPSLRLDSFTEEIASFVADVRKSGFTFAPETGTERLRQAVNKNIRDEDLLRSVQIAVKNGWRTLKFYFMIGLPTETKEDIEGIIELMKRVVEVIRSYGHIKLHVSVSPFSPKSHTPFQWEKQDTTEEFWNKINLLRQNLKKFKQIKFSWRDPAVSELECILGRGDRRLASVILEAWRNGSKFDGWNDLFQYTIWDMAFKKNNILRTEYTSEIAENRPLPWEHIDKGISRQFLIEERHKAYAAIESQDCRTGTCSACGLQRWDKTCFEYSDQRKEDQDTDQVKPSRTVEVSYKNFRVHFAKFGYARFLSHLDVMRTFERAARRADLVLEYSSGFNPRPKFSFGPALALGFTSEAEYFDVHAYCATAEDLTSLLNRELPDGLHVIGSKIIDHKVSSLAAVINAADYIISLEGQNIDPKRLIQIMEQNEIIVIRKIKNHEKQLNIRPHIESMQKMNGSLYIRSRTLDNRSVRPNEILRHLFQQSGFDPTFLPIHRKAQFVITGSSILTPLDII